MLYRTLTRTNFRKLTAGKILLQFRIITSTGEVYRIPEEYAESYAEIIAFLKRTYAQLEAEGKNPVYAVSVDEDDLIRQIEFQDSLIRL